MSETMLPSGHEWRRSSAPSRRRWERTLAGVSVVVLLWLSAASADVSHVSARYDLNFSDLTFAGASVAYTLTEDFAVTPDWSWNPYMEYTSLNLKKAYASLSITPPPAPTTYASSIVDYQLWENMTWDPFTDDPLGPTVTSGLRTLSYSTPLSDAPEWDFSFIRRLVNASQGTPTYELVFYDGGWFHNSYHGTSLDNVPFTVVVTLPGTWDFRDPYYPAEAGDICNFFWNTAWSAGSYYADGKTWIELTNYDYAGQFPELYFTLWGDVVPVVPLPGAALLGVLGLGCSVWRLRRRTT